MKSSPLLRLCSLVILLLSPLCSSAQLAPGAIAFTGFESRGANTADWFSFVLCQPLPPGTTINFTDKGYLGNNAFGTSTLDGAVSWTYPSSATVALRAGSEVTISNGIAYLNGSTTTTVGTVGILEGNATTGVNLSGADQVIAYQGTLGGTPAATMIAGLHWNVCVGSGNVINTSDAAWDASSTCAGSASVSLIPPGLTGGTHAIWMGVSGTSPYTSATYNCANNPAPYSSNNFRNSVNNSNNWTGKTIGVSGTVNPPTGSACGRTYYATILPVSLLSFEASQAPAENQVVLQWTVKNEEKVAHYEIERSQDATSFYSIGQTAAVGRSETYQFNDLAPVPGSSWYRLVVHELNGTRQYSPIIKVSKSLVDSWTNTLVISPVPATTSLDIATSTGSAIGKIRIVDLVGRSMYESDVNAKTVHLDVRDWHNGLYLIQTGNGTTYKIIKQH